MNTRISYWLTIIVTALVVLGIAIAVATSLQAYSNKLFVRGKSDFPAVSAEQSAERGAFQYALATAKPTVTVDGRDYTVSAAWVERRMEPQFPYVWLKRWEPLDGYQLVLRIEGLPYEGVCELTGVDDQPLLRPLPEDIAVMVAKFPSLEAIPSFPIRLQVHLPKAAQTDGSGANAAGAGATGNISGSASANTAGYGEIVLTTVP